MRRLIALFLVAAAFTSAVDAPALRADDATDAAQAAKEIADARQRADDAAQAYFDAVSRVDQLEVERGQLERDVAALQKVVDALEAQIQEVAVNRYTGSGRSSLPLVTGFKSAGDLVQIDALIDVVNSTSADDFDRFHEMSDDLDTAERDLADKAAQADDEKARLADLRSAATNEVQHLKAVEADRLRDDAIRKAVAAEEAERARREAAAQRAEAATTTTVAAGTAIVGAGANADDSGTSTAVFGTNGSEIGGRTGNGGSGIGVPIGGVGGDFGGPGWVCPTGAEVMAFTDTWGAPRSGGRRHQGVDLIGVAGAPVLAVVDGVAVGKENELGGTTVSLTGNDGNRYYYAHLESYVNLGQVTKGTVIGFLGQTGNTRFSVPHLHFEIHPGGGSAVDPYQTVRAHCP